MTRPMSKDTETALIKKDIAAAQADIANLHKEVHELKAGRELYHELKKELALIHQGQADAKEHREKFERNLDDKLSVLITRDQFSPVRRIVYGAIGIVLSSVVLALVSLVVITGKPS